MGDSRYDTRTDHLREMLKRIQILEESILKISDNQCSVIDKTGFNKSNCKSTYLEEENSSVTINTTQCYKNENNSDSKPNKKTMIEVDTSGSLLMMFLTLMFSHKNQHGPLYYIFLLAIHLLSFSISFIYIKDYYVNWQSSPVVQAISNQLIHIDNIPFPAVTICWPNGFNQDYDVFESFEKCFDCENTTGACKFRNASCTYSELLTLAFADAMCPRLLSNYSDFTHSLPKAMDNIELYTYIIKSLLPPCQVDEVQMLVRSKDVAVHTRCDIEVFQPFLSINIKQLCMTYNGLPHEEIFRTNVVNPIVLEKYVINKSINTKASWSLDNMIEFKGGLDTVPMYGVSDVAFRIEKPDRKYVDICNYLGKDIVFSVIIHSPNEIPLDYDNVIEYALRENTARGIMVTPKVTLTGGDLVQYLPHQRGCLYPQERNLIMFKSYSKKKCDVECLANRYLETCGCVPYNYPRQNKTVPVCIHLCTRPQYRCDCPPDCNSLSYDIQVLETTQLDPDRSVPNGQIDVYFLENEYYTNIRYNIISFGDFLAYSLGVIGVFNGFSVICFWELLYGVIVRLWTSLKNSSLQSMQ